MPPIHHLMLSDMMRSCSTSHANASPHCREEVARLQRDNAALAAALHSRPSTMDGTVPKNPAVASAALQQQRVLAAEHLCQVSGVLSVASVDRVFA